MKRENKRTRRALLIAVLALVVCVATIGGTVAWLTASTDTVQNTFSPSDINIELKETGTTAGENIATKDYDMVPGEVLEKDPKVTVKAGSEDLWLFVKVVETAPEVKDGVNATYTLANFLTYTVETGEGKWTALGESYPGVYYKAVAASDADQTFDVLTGNQVTVNTGVTKEMMNNLTAGPKLSFKAYAIQQANITAKTGKTVQETAWELAYAS